MTTSTATLTDFLLARIAEEEESAERLAGAYERDEVQPRARLIMFDALVVPARVLADCKAKRAIVERCDAVDYAMPSMHLAHSIIGYLAQPYASHPDFQHEWLA